MIMTQEEKAKAYDEAVKLIKDNLDALNKIAGTGAFVVNIQSIRNCFYRAFPELKESEDEEIRKGLIKAFGSIGKKEWGGVNVKNTIAWLEKQGEQKSAELPKSEDYGIDGLYAAIDILQKTLGEVDGYQSDDGILSHKCAISAVKELSKQKPAWSEEDKDMISTIISDLKRHGGDTTYSAEVDWLKQFQPKPEWSEEDEARIKNILSVLDVQVCWDGATGKKGNPYQKEIDWLKSLRPQKQWKPTDEQIKALHDLNVTGGISYAGQGQELINLYNELNKLKG